MDDYQSGLGCLWCHWFGLHNLWLSCMERPFCRSQWLFLTRSLDHSYTALYIPGGTPVHLEQHLQGSQATNEISLCGHETVWLTLKLWNFVRFGRPVGCCRPHVWHHEKLGVLRLIEYLSKCPFPLLLQSSRHTKWPAIHGLGLDFPRPTHLPANCVQKPAFKDNPLAALFRCLQSLQATEKRSLESANALVRANIAPF